MVEYRRGEYIVSTDPRRLDVGAVHRFLSRRSYWARGIPREVVERSLRHSLVFGVYGGDRLVGFGRVITDYATHAYVSDVFIMPRHRGRGLGTWLVECMLRHPELQGLRQWSLVTADAQDLYRKVGFTCAENPEKYMEILNRDIYDTSKRRARRGNRPPGNA